MCPRVSDSHKEQRRQAILDAAMEVFIGKGYQLATINDVASTCGMSVGAIYRYFPAKSDLMLSLVTERLGRAPELFARLTENAGDPWQRLEKSVDLFISALRVRHPATGRLLLATMAEALQDGEVRRGLHERFGALVTYVQAIITEGVETGLFRSDVDPGALAALLLGTADGVAVYWVTGAPEIELRTMRNALVSMLQNYLVVGE